MTSLFQGKQSLPVSQSSDLTSSTGGNIRRRLSSLSLNLKIQPPSASPAASWATSLRRSKSVTSAADSISKWWDWGWGWILTRKPTFARDLEMNEEEAVALGCQNKGSWRHVLYKITSQLRRRLTGADNVTLPQTFRYDSFNKKTYSKK